MLLFLMPQHNHTTKAHPENSEEGSVKNWLSSLSLTSPWLFSHMIGCRFPRSGHQVNRLTHHQKGANKLSREQSWLWAVHLDINTLQLEPEVHKHSTGQHTAVAQAAPSCPGAPCGHWERHSTHRAQAQALLCCCSTKAQFVGTCFSSYQSPRLLLQEWAMGLSNVHL